MIQKSDELLCLKELTKDYKKFGGKLKYFLNIPVAPYKLDKCVAVHALTSQMQEKFVFIVSVESRPIYLLLFWIEHINQIPATSMFNCDERLQIICKNFAVKYAIFRNMNANIFRGIISKAHEASTFILSYEISTKCKMLPKHIIYGFNSKSVRTRSRIHF